MTICPICSNGEIFPYTNQSWSIWGEEYKLLSCKTCESISTYPMPDNEVLARLYSECFDYRWYQDHYPAKMRDCRYRVNEYKAFLGQRVLDFGGGVGYLSKALREASYESVTYDPFCRQGDKKDGLWDTVIALHVLEHANDADRTLCEMKELLVSGGRLILAVPNAGGVGYRELGMHWVWAQPPLLHTLHFTTTGLSSLLERHGFVIEEVRYADRWDANSYCDLDQVEKFKNLDALWGRRPYNRIGLYRKACAAYVSARRYKGLQKALSDRSQNSKDLSELQIIARLATSK